MTKGADMRKLMAMVVLFCSAISTSAVAAEKSDHLLMLMVKSKDGKTQHGEQMVPAKTCHSVAETFAKAHANKVPFTMTPRRARLARRGQADHRGRRQGENESFRRLGTIRWLACW
jgi:hypothetical protein